MEPNLHESFEMVYIKKGEADFIVNGSLINVGPDDIIIIKPLQYHKFIVKSDAGCEFIVLNFKFENRVSRQYSRYPCMIFSVSRGGDSGPTYLSRWGGKTKLSPFSTGY
jgi:oxalate decarboxylase/phosphoglucose isomerase-like protein (cupin superfamily)